MISEDSKNQALEQIKTFHPLTNDEIKNLESFVDLLLEKNTEFNLIGKSTIEDIWNRHILDSAQLLRFINNTNLKFADLGTGAGFPGIVLSILGVKEIHLIDKSFRKTEFLRLAKEISPNKIFVHCNKLEEMAEIKFDCITSRALAPLTKLLAHNKKFLEKDGYCLFLKGKSLNSEIELAKENFDFNYDLYSSLTSKESNIIKIK